MAKLIFLSTPCLTCLAFLAAAALSRQIRPIPAAAPEPFFVQNTPLDRREGNDARQLFEQILGPLRKARWLKATIWQQAHHAGDGFESEARLTLGPDHCARMEVLLRTAAGSCELLTICDGKVFAEITRFPGDEPKVTSSFLPGPEAIQQRDNILRKHGCAGPLPLLTELGSMASAWRVESGVWRQQRVLRLEAAIEPKFNKAGVQTPQPARMTRLYCDAATLSPLRLEWYADDKSQVPRLLLEMEYRQLELDRPLTPEECARAFTYKPNP